MVKVTYVDAEGAEMLIEADEGDTKIANRLNVLDELLNTERDYLADLTYTVDVYLVPLRQGEPRKGEQGHSRAPS